jgi:hypothetical protein
VACFLRGVDESGINDLNQLLVTHGAGMQHRVRIPQMLTAGALEARVLQCGLGSLQEHPREKNPFVSATLLDISLLWFICYHRQNCCWAATSK